MCGDGMGYGYEQNPEGVTLFGDDDDSTPEEHPLGGNNKIRDRTEPITFVGQAAAESAFALFSRFSRPGKISLG